MATAALVPSTQRPIPLKAREDLVFERIEYLGEGYWVVKDPVALKYYRLQPEQYHTLWLLDGKRSLEQIRDELLQKLPTVRLQLTDIQHLVTDLHEKGLVYSERPGQGAALLKKRRENLKQQAINTIRSILYIRLPGWDPEPVLQWLYPWVRWAFHPVTVFLTVAFIASAWLFLAIRFDEFRRSLPEFYAFFGWPNLLYLWLTLGAAKILHEFGHGLTCKHFGGECHAMGVMLLVFSPCLYCDVSDSWMLKNKWHRIAIGGAGIYVEVFLSALAIYVWWFTSPGLLHAMALNVFFVTTITTVIWNANPLMRFDGYFMMADFLEIPNLRPKADRLLREAFAWYCLGIESQEDPFMPDRGRWKFITFAIAAGLYRWFIVAVIVVFLYTVLKPYGLQSIGVFLAVTSVVAIVGNMGYNLYQIISAPRIDPMSRPKIAITVLVVLSLIAAALLIPLPLPRSATFIVEPHKVQHVYTAVPGFLEEVFVQPGEHVEQGQLLVRLSNPEKEDRYRELLAEKKVQEQRVQTFLALDDPAQRALAEQKVEDLEKQIAEYERQLAELEIRAPIAGTVVEPPRQREATLEQLETRLSSWDGTPLDRKNIGCYLQERTHLLSIAPDDRFQAILLIDQGDRNDVEVGKTRMRLKFEHLPDRVYEGTLEDISKRHLEFVPELLSAKLGGEVPTVTDSEGRERLLSIAYQATVLIDEDVPLLRTGLRGKARFWGRPRSLGLWAWRYLKRTFKFRL